MARARKKGRKTEKVSKAFTKIEFRKKDRKYNVFHLESQKGFETTRKIKGGYEAGGVVDSIAVMKMRDLNTLEIVLIERKTRGREGSLPSRDKDLKTERDLLSACKKVIIKYAIFRHKIGKEKSLCISKRIK